MRERSVRHSETEHCLDLKVEEQKRYVKMLLKRFHTAALQLQRVSAGSMAKVLMGLPQHCLEMYLSRSLLLFAMLLLVGSFEESRLAWSEAFRTREKRSKPSF